MVSSAYAPERYESPKSLAKRKSVESPRNSRMTSSTSSHAVNTRQRSGNTVSSKKGTYSFTKKYPVDFDVELKIGDVRYDNIT